MMKLQRTFGFIPKIQGKGHCSKVSSLKSIDRLMDRSRAITKSINASISSSVR